MPFSYNPFVTVHVDDVIGGEFFHVHETQSGEADKDKGVTDESEVGILKLIRDDGFQFFFCQIGSFLAVGTDMELREWVTGYLAVIMRSQHNTFQPHATLPDGSVCQSSVIAEIDRELFDELRCQFQHGYVCAAVVQLNELFHVIS